MGKYKVILKPAAIKDIAEHEKSDNKAILKRITAIIRDLEENPYIGIGKPEQLKYDLQGYWSRRINKKDRIVYKVEENVVTVFVVSAMGHYQDR